MAAPKRTRYRAKPGEPPLERALGHLSFTDDGAYDRAVDGPRIPERLSELAKSTVFKASASAHGRLSSAVAEEIESAILVIEDSRESEDQRIALDLRIRFAIPSDLEVTTSYGQVAVSELNGSGRATAAEQTLRSSALIAARGKHFPRVTRDEYKLLKRKSVQRLVYALTQTGAATPSASGPSSPEDEDPATSVKNVAFDFGYRVLRRHSTSIVDIERPDEITVIDDFTIEATRDGMCMFRRYLKWAARDATLIEPPKLEQIVNDEPLESTEMSVVVPLEADHASENLNDLLLHMNGERICLVYLGRAYDASQIVRFRLTHRFANRDGNSDHWLVASPRFVDYGNFHLTLIVPQAMATPELLFNQKSPAGEPIASHFWSASDGEDLGDGMSASFDSEKGSVQADWEVTDPVMNDEYIISFHPFRRTTGEPRAESPTRRRRRIDDDDSLADS